MEIRYFYRNSKGIAFPFGKNCGFLKIPYFSSNSKGITLTFGKEKGFLGDFIFLRKSNRSIITLWSKGILKFLLFSIKCKGKDI